MSSNSMTQLSIDTKAGFPDNSSGESPTPPLVPSSTASTHAKSTDEPPATTDEPLPAPATPINHTKTSETLTNNFVRKFGLRRHAPSPTPATTTTTTTDEPSPAPATPNNRTMTLAKKVAQKLGFATPRNRTMTPEKLENMAKKFVHDLGLRWGALDEKCKNRVLRIMSPDYSHSPSKNNSVDRYTTTFKDEFRKFCESDEIGEGWENFSWTFFDAKAIKDYLVIRLQTSGICSLHAPVVVQHYLQSLRIVRGKAEGEPCNHKMLDISDFLRTKLPREQQKRYVATGTCGITSLDFFKAITGLESHHLESIQLPMKSESPFLFRKDVDSLLTSYNHLKAPALVSSFRIEQAFHDFDILEGEVEKQNFRAYAASQEKRGLVLHSMVMLGMHKDDSSSTVWILLQNFWKDRYFRLVSAEYLASCNPTIHFVLSDSIDVSLRNNPPVVDAEYAETALEFEECYPELEAEES
jgi:hypothetical protein